MSPALSKEGKSDGSRYKKIEKYERHEESGLSRFLFPLDETGSVHLSHLPFFSCPWKRPDSTLSLSLSPCLSPTISVSPSLSVPLPGWLWHTGQPQGGRTEGLCYGFVRGDGKKERGEMRRGERVARRRRMKRGGWGGGCPGRGKKNLSIQMLKRRVNTEWNHCRVL